MTTTPSPYHYLPSLVNMRKVKKRPRFYLPNAVHVKKLWTRECGESGWPGVHVASGYRAFGMEAVRKRRQEPQIGGMDAADTCLR